MNPHDMVGHRYSRLVVLKLREARRGKLLVWVCQCDCGETKDVTGADLRGGHTKSCGCLWREAITAHGGSNTPEFDAWCSMRRRCYNPRNPGYRNYGGRGIRVDAEWLDDFAVFLAYVGRRPSPRHSLDRYPDKNGPYAPGNVRWALPVEQSRNTRRNIYLQHEGVSRALPEWAEVKGLRYGTLATRIARGWSVERALETPAAPRPRKGYNETQ